jgi:hypothetical protein
MVLIKEEKKIVKKARASRSFVIALSLVSIVGFLSIVLESLFFIDVSNYVNSSWLFILGMSLILQTSLRELRAIKRKGLTSEYLGKITMIIIGSIAIIAAILSVPQIDIQNVSFLAVKGIISILAIVFIILQTWLSND